MNRFHIQLSYSAIIRNEEEGSQENVELSWLRNMQQGTFCCRENVGTKLTEGVASCRLCRDVHWMDVFKMRCLLGRKRPGERRIPRAKRVWEWRRWSASRCIWELKGAAATQITCQWDREHSLIADGQGQIAIYMDLEFGLRWVFQCWVLSL